MKRDQEAAGSACLTHYAAHCSPPWLAIHRETAISALKDYKLTPEQQTDAGWLMAGYCRLLDDAGLIYYGETEAEAVAKACGLLPPNASVSHCAAPFASRPGSGKSPLP